MKRFLQGDGGWDRVVWVDKELKVQVADAIPEELYDKIATEDDALDIDQVRQFLTEKKHPIIEKYWKNGEPVMMTLPGPGEDWPDEDIAEGA
jgi:acetyl-CoA decarbonylase/synthase complex subunit beta